MRVREIAVQLDLALKGTPNEEAHRESWTRYMELESNGQVSFFSFAILEKRFQRITQDGRIEPAELERVFEVVRDINQSSGNIDISKYPQGE